MASIFAIVVLLVEVRTWDLQKKLENCLNSKCNDIIDGNFEFEEIADELAYLRKLTKLNDAKIQLYYNPNAFNYDNVVLQRQQMAIFIHKKRSKEIKQKETEVKGIESLINSSDTVNFKQGTKYKIPDDVQTDITKIQNKEDSDCISEAAAKK